MGRRADRRKARAEERREKEQAEATRAAMRWTVRRLDILEFLILFLAILLALAGGALVAWFASAVVSFPFRLTWALSSLLLFIVPGGGVYLRELRRGRHRGTTDEKTEPKDPNG